MNFPYLTMKFHNCTVIKLLLLFQIAQLFLGLHTKRLFWHCTTRSGSKNSNIETSDFNDIPKIAKTDLEFYGQKLFYKNARKVYNPNKRL